MTDFAVLRIGKIKSLGGLSGGAAHNSRAAISGTNHADNRTPLMGGGSRLLLGSEDAVAAWKARAMAVNLSKPRKDAVRALEVVMSASPAWFNNASPMEREQWQADSLNWAIDLFGAENILSAHLHDDETTPHLHILTIPLAQKERRRSGRPRKGRERQARKTVKSWGLCAADYVGTPEKLIELQTAYATEVAHLGIRRGRPRRATGANHQSPAAYRAQMAKELTDVQHIQSQAIQELNEAQDGAAQILGEAQKAAAAFSLGLDAIDNEEITYREDLQRLEWNKVESPVLPTQTKSLWAWKRAVKPFFDILLGYAQSVSKLRKERDALDHRSSKLTKREKSLAADAATVSRLLARGGHSTDEVSEVERRIRQRTR